MLVPPLAAAAQRTSEATYYEERYGLRSAITIPLLVDCVTSSLRVSLQEQGLAAAAHLSRASLWSYTRVPLSLAWSVDFDPIAVVSVPGQHRQASTVMRQHRSAARRRPGQGQGQGRDRAGTGQ